MPPGMTTLTWLGHSGFVIEDNGERVAVDVWQEGPTYPKAADVSGLKAVLVSHGHFDHAESAPALCKDGATLVCIHEVSFWAMAQGVPEDRVVGMNKGGTFALGDWRFTMVQAIHSGGCPGEQGAIVPGGSAAGWIIQTPSGDRIYHAGDTCAFLDMQLIKELHRPDIALLPIGGHYTMGPREAAKAVGLLGVHHVVPMHHGTFPALAGTPDELREHCPANVAVHAMEPNGTLDLDELVVVA